MLLLFIECFTAWLFAILILLIVLLTNLNIEKNINNFRGDDLYLLFITRCSCVFSQ